MHVLRYPSPHNCDACRKPVHAVVVVARDKYLCAACTIAIAEELDDLATKASIDHRSFEIAWQ
jgi:hypothetical protein